jgi:CDP-paratose 2-epimerase
MRLSWLITGGCGFAGSNLADHLLANNHEVCILDNLSRFGSELNLAWLRERHGAQFPFIQADTRDAAAVVNAVVNWHPGVIAHLAGQVAATTSLADPRFDFEVNAGGTLNVLEAVRQRRPETIVLYSSTNKVYGSLERHRYEELPTRYRMPDYPNGLDEDFPLDGSTPYGCSKLSAEQYVRDYYRIYGIRTAVFRHSSMYGGRQFSTFDQGWVGWFCQKAIEMLDPAAETITIAGNGKQVRDLLHANDLIRCYTNAVEHIESAQGEIFNIGGGAANSLSLLELFEQLKERTGAPMRYRETPWRIADQKYFVADTAKAARLMDWRVTTPYSAGLDLMLEWRVS